MTARAIVYKHFPTSDEVRKLDDLNTMTSLSEAYQDMLNASSSELLVWAVGHSPGSHVPVMCLTSTND